MTFVNVGAAFACYNLLNSKQYMGHPVDILFINLIWMNETFVWNNLFVNNQNPIKLHSFKKLDQNKRKSCICFNVKIWNVN